MFISIQCLYTYSTISPSPAFPGVGYDIGWDSNLIVIKSLFAQYILHYYIGLSQQNREYSIVHLKLLKEAKGFGMLGIVRSILTYVGNKNLWKI